MTMKPNSSSKVFVVALIVALGLSAFVNVLLIKNLVYDSPVLGFESNTYDCRNQGYINELTVYVGWKGQPAQGILVDIRDKNLLLVTKGTTDNIGSVYFNLKKTNGLLDKTAYYARVVYTVNFLEGGTETRFIYYIFLFSYSADKGYRMEVGFEPATWSDSPTIKIGS